MCFLAGTQDPTAGATPGITKQSPAAAVTLHSRASRSESNKTRGTDAERAMRVVDAGLWRQGGPGSNAVPARFQRAAVPLEGLQRHGSDALAHEACISACISACIRVVPTRINSH